MMMMRMMGEEKMRGDADESTLVTAAEDDGGRERIRTGFRFIMTRGMFCAKTSFQSSVVGIF